MFKLPFYKLLYDDNNYTPYRVFVLESRIYPTIYRMFEDVQVFMRSKYEKNRMQEYLVIANYENQPINMTEEQQRIIEEKIDEIMSIDVEYALINIRDLYDSLTVFPNIQDTKNSDMTIVDQFVLPSYTWFTQIVPYLEIPDQYFPFYSEEGIFLKFDSDSQYKETYYHVCNELVQQTIYYHRIGAVLIEDGPLIQDWKLTPLSEDNKLWYSEIKIEKNMVDFLTRKKQGCNCIRIKVPDNLVQRHVIVESLNNRYPMVFEGSYLKIQVKNLREALDVKRVNFMPRVTGRVLTLGASKIEDIQRYFDYADQHFSGYSAVSYLIDDLDYPYIFSIMINSELRSDREMTALFQ